MIRSLAVMFASLSAGMVFLGAQQPTFRRATDTVSIYATVVDATGRPVSVLSRDDFDVFDDGVRQDLTLFRNDLQPITIVVMLDRSGSMLPNFAIVREAAEQFVGDLLDGDKAKVGSFSKRVQIDPDDFTSDHQELIRILRNNLQDAGPTPLWKATDAAMTALEGQEGRRVVLVFTDGYDNPLGGPTTVTLDDVTSRSRTDETMVYAIGLAEPCAGSDPPTGGSTPAPTSSFQRGGGPSGGGRIPRGGPVGGPVSRPPINNPFGLPGPDVFGGKTGGRNGRRSPDSTSGAPDTSCTSVRPDPGLKDLAGEGGGAYFELHRTDDLASTFARVADELHHQYLLAFKAADLDGRLHKLEVHMRNPDLEARARRSYVAEK